MPDKNDKDKYCDLASSLGLILISKLIFVGATFLLIIAFSEAEDNIEGAVYMFFSILLYTCSIVMTWATLQSYGEYRLREGGKNEP